ncbi:unnamed protein product [Heterobilharzia americana]|nr:unnamed protein product [Heterobilharzia americana]
MAIVQISSSVIVAMVHPNKDVYYDFHDTTDYQDTFWLSLPMDLETLQNLSVIDYLRQYVHFSDRKRDLYQRIYNHWCRSSRLSIEKLNNAFEDIIPVQIPNGCCELIFNLIGIQQRIMKQ